MPMEMTFPGGLVVEASVNGFSIRTDQPAAAGGEGSAPSPFDLYLASLGTCAGFFALRFCQQRDLATEGLTLSMDWERDPETRLPVKVSLRIGLPQDFPEKYKGAIIRATDQCAVKRSIFSPPDFEVSAE